MFLTEAVAVLREIQNQNRDELYLYSEYDPQIYFPKLLSKDTFASQIRCQLAMALEEHNKLLCIILLIFGNKDVDDKVLNPEGTRRVWSALFSEIDRAVRTRKEDLPRKAQNEGEPRVIVANMFSRFKDHNNKTDQTKESFKTKRRRLNGILPQVANNYDYQVLQVNGIIPDNSEIFAVNTGHLNGRGLKEYWDCISRELKILDVRQREKEKQQIIEAHYKELREQRRLAEERNQTVRDRCSLPRSIHPRNLDRGDGQQSVQGRQARARSVPNRGRAGNRNLNRK